MEISHMERESTDMEQRAKARDLDVDEAYESFQDPQKCKGLIEALVYSGRMADIIEQCADLREQKEDLLRKLSCRDREMDPESEPEAMIALRRAAELLRKEEQAGWMDEPS